MPKGNRSSAPARIHIQYPQPVVDAGRYPAKRTVGDLVEVSVDAFRDGHEKLRAVVLHRRAGDRKWAEAELHQLDAHHNGVRWGGSFVVDRTGRWEWTIEAWTDLFATWRDELRRKLEGGQHDLSGELSEGVVLLEAAASAAKGPDKKLIQHALGVLTDTEVLEAAKHDAALGLELYAAVERNAERHGAARLEPALGLEVDRVLARFGSWYELFPRSWGGLAGVQEQLPAIAELGFDVVYVPPIHPIGATNRKGRNNVLVAAAEDPGSPYGIGSELGGHDAVHPELGTHEDVRALCAAAAEHGIDIALDFAINASPDHPWLKEHPDWFHRRPDGTLKYAENPPKKYQDIYNVNWDTADWRALWDELLRIVLVWVELGVKVFRVDNPHTKPIPFWEWLIAEVHKVDRDVIFLVGGVHEARDDAPAGQDRLPAGLHVLHLEEHPPRADGVRRRAGLGPGARVLPPELLHQHARHPQRLPRARRAGRVLHALRARRDAEPDATASTRATSTTRTCRSRRGPRST